MKEWNMMNENQIIPRNKLKKNLQDQEIKK